MTRDEWRHFLQDLSQVVLAGDLEQVPENRLFSPEAHAAGYIGRAGATEEQIAAAEQRLGARLPPSYRTFLSVTNGLPILQTSVMPGELWSADKIYWLRERDPDNLLPWGDDVEPDEDISPDEHVYERDNGGSAVSYRHAYVANLLSISAYLEGSSLLMSPDVIDTDGEWECWHIANWYPGASRFRTFEMWLQEQYHFLTERE